MADALLSPAVGGALWAAGAGAVAWSSRRLRQELDDRRIPLMGVLGAFVFAVQMINFTIPGTGSSGHLGGGMILAALLGPHAALLTIASVLTVQALCFADGGLLALGANIINLGVFPCIIAYPLLFRSIAGERPTPRRLRAASLLAAVAGLQLGALGVVLETALSGIAALPLGTFLLFMLPIHLAIGVVEGLITAAVVISVRQARPEVLSLTSPLGTGSLRRLLVPLALAAVVTAGVLSWFASNRPDGLEWAVASVAGNTPPVAPAAGVHPPLAQLQERVAVFPGYGFPAPTGTDTTDAESAWPAVAAGTSAAGLIGGVLTLVLTVLLGVGLKAADRRHRARGPGRTG